MKRVAYWIVAIMMLVVAVPAHSQSKEAKKAVKKIQKAERKKEKNAQLIENRKQFLSLIEDKTFVLEAHTLYDRYFNSYFVTPSTNFVMVDGDKLVMQLGFNHRVGFNGLGGITIEGRIASYEIIEGKENGPLTIRTQVTSPILGGSTVTMSIYNDGHATANVISSFGSKITFSGNFVDHESTTAFKGFPSYY
ncbi:DUF4251 domain-containing protein [Fulvivirgaceae bacterium BMA10]|uniref:DUF4251 domain-containing protein n=1 Tax=Splendidivirga corallicola TaxID=3051826 RepID=A0ABT8KSM9_9BACT|nr:DUF4251 domain-containing protein [Fulvivirgaceae bacterium BMA10]